MAQTSMHEAASTTLPDMMDEDDLFMMFDCLEGLEDDDGDATQDICLDDSDFEPVAQWIATGSSSAQQAPPSPTGAALAPSPSASPMPPPLFPGTAAPQQQQAERLNSLARSMRRTEQTRNQILTQSARRPGAPMSPATTKRQRAANGVAPHLQVSLHGFGASTRGSSNAGAAVTPQSLLSLSSFLSGNRATLTSGLEQSRRMVRQHMGLLGGRTGML